ncbi:hypothetical protein AXF42_Ash003763 [Apostasia shenzhenica]|uniref:Uncharacterized protein n=1 Tax=Apostasia shenzhenica TaxID=1088818 RepID=A0A2I0AI27_9ASPA|nr:hypothetical protein AXF42_Ash003763 [Apostasia shenzhenica]
MQHASSIHANQGSAFPSCHKSPETVPRSKGQVLFTDSGLSSGRQAARTQSLPTSFPPENQDKAAPSATYKYQGAGFKKRDRKREKTSPKGKIIEDSPQEEQNLSSITSCKTGV